MPSPNTAAGRAAALRPPRAAPKRVVVAPPPPPKKSHKLRWFLIALGLVVALILAALIGTKLIRSNYYVGEDGGRVAILRGAPYSVLGYSFQDVAWLGCVSRSGMLQVVTPEETHALCRTLDIDDLQPTGREQVRQGFPSGSLDQARADLARVVAGNLLPLCEERKPAPQPTPSPQPTPTPAPTAEPTATGEPTAPPPAPAPETTTPPSTTPAQIPGQNCRPD